MAAEAKATEAQQALFRQWSDNTDFVLDVHDSPKRQFNILAQTHGWIGGEEPWNANWFKCFDQEYTWRGVGATVQDKSEGVIELSHTIWLQFPGFTPNPQDKLNDEFKRLAEHQGWDKKEQAKRRPEFIDAEFEQYYGANSVSIRNWQKLCRVCLVEPVPDSIVKCVEALSELSVNIVNLVNNRRTGEPVLIFPTKRHFIDYTYPHNTYPRRQAQHNILMNCLLRPVTDGHYKQLADQEFATYSAGQAFDDDVGANVD